MKKKQIKGIKVNVFEEKELKEKLGMNEEQIQLVITYQERFPELLQTKDGFCIEAENLWINLGKPQGEYSKWFNRKINPLFKENKDYSRFAKFVGTIKNNKGKEVKRHLLTLDTAKHISLLSGADKKSSEEVRLIGRSIRDYFILIESTLRNYEEWNISRGDEKDGWNKMEQYIKEWCIRKDFDHTIRKFYTREANLLNQALLGYDACEINYMLKNNDKITRNHLSTNINNALHSLQELNCSLLMVDMSFEQREKIIRTTCINKYPDLKIEFLNIVNS